MEIQRTDPDERVAYRVAFAHSTLRFVGVGLGSDEHQKLVERVAAERITADEAVELTARRYGVSIDRSQQFTPSSFDDYLVPGESALRSRIVDRGHPLGIVDHEQFRAVEVEISRIRAAEFAVRPERGHYDYEHLRAIHRRLFSDIYPWAGEQRVGPESAMVRFARDAVGYERTDPRAPMITYAYYPGTEVAEAVSVQFAQLQLLARRKDLSHDEAVTMIGEYAGEILAIHPFRDGNLRAQWVYAMLYDEHVGYPIDPFEVLRAPEILDDITHEAYRYQATGDFGGMVDTAARILSKPTPSEPVRQR